MKHQRVVAALAAFLLSGMLISCGGAEEPADTAASTVVAAPEVAQPTKPPPIIAANTVEPVAGQPDTGDDAPSGDAASGDANAPALPTAVPTAAPTEAPPTEVPTETPPPTAAPVVQAPAPPVAPPPAAPPTAAPPTAPPPTAVPQGANGLIASHFAIQDRAELFVNGDIWFEFTVANSTGGDVPFDALGVMPKKDGVDRPEWYQHSYGGNNDKISAGGLSWDDHINLPEGGNYTLRLVVCFDGAACTAQRGTWHTLSPEIPIQVVRR